MEQKQTNKKTLRPSGVSDFEELFSDEETQVPEIDELLGSIEKALQIKVQKKKSGGCGCG
jgi:hypothetical protein